jgi:hypothetical protein
VAQASFTDVVVLWSAIRKLIAVECWSGSFANLAGTDNVFGQDNEGTARAPSFLFWHYADRKGGNDGEAAISGSIPALLLHCNEVLRTNFGVRAVLRWSGSTFSMRPSACRFC